MAKRYARECGKAYESLRLIVAHLGSGISVSAHAEGRMIDVTNSREEGAFSTERAGGVPAMQLVELCFSGRYTQREVEAALFREGGLYSYLGTKDLVEVEQRIDSGAAHAKLVFGAMVYQIAKEIGAMAAVLQGRVDALLVTGGMAHSQLLLSALEALRGLDCRHGALSGRRRIAGPGRGRTARAARRRRSLRDGYGSRGNAVEQKLLTTETGRAALKRRVRCDFCPRLSAHCSAVCGKPNHMGKGWTRT